MKSNPQYQRLWGFPLPELPSLAEQLQPEKLPHYIRVARIGCGVSRKPKPIRDSSSTSTEVYIYGLVDPMTKQVFYVGCTCDLKTRHGRHISEALSNHVDQTRKVVYIQDLLRRSLKPELFTFETVLHADWKKRERYWIEEMERRDQPITNEAKGGCCFVGRRHRE